MKARNQMSWETLTVAVCQVHGLAKQGEGDAADEY